MSRFNLADYETVAERIARFYADHPDGRILTELLQTLDDPQGWRFVVRASIYVGEEMKATGLAEERLNGKGANQDAALENAETSAIGRGLANWKYSGAKRASREEMGKSQRYAKPAEPPQGDERKPTITDGSVPEKHVMWLDMLKDATTTAEVQAVADEIRGDKGPEWLLEEARKRWSEVA